MLNTPRINKLEREVEHLHILIAMAEPWAKSYEKDEASHTAIIKHEAKLDRAMRGYFRGLKDRVGNYINWSIYQQRSMKAFDVNVTVNTDQYANEDAILLTVITDLSIAGIAIGTSAGESIYQTPLGLTNYSDIVQNFAKNYSAELVKNINATTLSYIQRSLETSIKLGETTDLARARIDQMIGDSRRSGTIARTESVNSYQSGIQLFGTESGAVGKEWQAIQGACQICAPLDGLSVPINDDYNSDVGQTPPGHPNCRCGQRLIYQNELDANPHLLDGEG